jgi:hypothetical protein
MDTNIYYLPQAGGRILSQGNYCLSPAGGRIRSQGNYYCLPPAGGRIRSQGNKNAPPTASHKGEAERWADGWAEKGQRGSIGL